MSDKEKKPRGYWTYERCYELAVTCKSKAEMKKKNNRAYDVARKNCWFIDYTWFLTTDELRHQKRPSRVKWNYDKCKSIALQYKKLSEFMKDYPSVYTVSHRHGWINDFDWLDREISPFVEKKDNVYGYFFIQQKAVYIGRTIDPENRDIAHRKSGTVFNFASNNKIDIPEMKILETELTIEDGLIYEDLYVEEYKSHGWIVLNKAKTGIKSGSIGGLGQGKWNYQSCKKEAEKYNSLKDFRLKSPSVYNLSLKENWLNNFTWLNREQKNAGFWTYENCYKEAKKYKTRTQFQKNSGSAYDASLKNNWLDDYIWFLPSATAKKWNYETCLEEAQKYKTLSDFRKCSSTAYRVSRENGWFKEYVWLYKKDISKKEIVQYTIGMKIVNKYSSLREAVRITGINHSSISRCCNGKLNNAGGFIWKYAA